MSPTPRLGRLAPGLLVLFASLAALTASDTALSDSLRFLLALVWLVMVPGVVLHRALRGRPDTMLEDLGWGLATGLSVMVVAAGVFTFLGIPQWQGLAPLAVLAPVLAVPRWRGVLTVAPYPSTVPAGAAWLGALAALWMLAQATWRAYAAWAMPPGPFGWHVDMSWYLGLLGELKRAMPPQVPQVAGEPFLYHWFSSLWMAGMQQVSGASIEAVVARLWVVPMVWGVVATTMALGLHLTRRAWVGAGAAVLFVGGAQLCTATWFNLSGLDPMVFSSPSHLYGILIMLAVMAPVVDLLRGRPLRAGGWAFVLFMVATCGGSKSSILPPMLCAVLLVGAVSLLRREPLRGSLLALGVTVVGMLFTLPLSSGGSAGSAVKLLSTVVAGSPWVREYGPLPPDQFADLVPAQLRTGAGLALAAALVLTYVVRVGWVATGLPALRLRDPAPWFLLGTCLAGFGALMLIAQDGMSQVYFVRGGLVAWTLLAAWGAALTWDRVTSSMPPSRAAAVAVLGSGLGVLVVSLAQRVAGDPARGEVLGSVVRSTGLVLAAAALATALMLLLRRRGLSAPVALASTWALFAATLVPAALGSLRLSNDPWSLTAWRVPVPAALVALLACLGAAALLWGGSRPQRPQVTGRLLLVTASVVLAVLTIVRLPAWTSLVRSTDPAVTVSAAEYRAARWVDAHAGQQDVVATNVHCLVRGEQPATRPATPGCDARGFWVSGFTQRRSLMDGWAYTVQAHEAHGVGNVNSRNVAFHDLELFALNEAAFTDPTREGLDRLWKKGVRWLFADELAGPVSPRLRDLAELVHTDGPVTVYRLRPA